MNGKELMSNLKFYESYSKYNYEKGRKETWEESTEDVMKMHYKKFKHIPQLLPYLKKAEKAYKNKEILASQRNLQFRGEQINKHNIKLFNCSSSYIDRPEVFKEIMYILLGGCGVGYSVEKRFVDKLPTIKQRNENTVTHVIEDSIEGWALAIDELMKSFFNGTEKVRFDGTQIRPKGAEISGGYKAPGYEPLKKSLEKIETLLDNLIKSGENTLSTLNAHDIICYIADSVLSGGVRRSALIVLFDKDDKLMLECKTGNWFYDNPQRSRANNSVKLLKSELTQDEFNKYKESIKQYGEPGVVLVDDIDFNTNPCCEIGFIPVNPTTGKSCWSLCNLNEINGGKCDTPEKFYKACESASILGTLQASYTNIPFLGEDTKQLIEEESLIGVSITGIMDSPEILLNPEILRKGVGIVKKTNEKIAEIIGINPAARLTTVKPSGNASVILGTSSGIHPAHSKRYFRIMQMNKENEMAQLLKESNPSMIAESVWSESGNDYVVYVPIEESPGSLVKKDLTGVDFVKHVQTVYENWVLPGTVKGRGYSDRVTHNVSNTITVDNWDKVFDYIYENKNAFCGLSFIPFTGDKIYNQAPFTEVLTLDEIIEKYGKGALLASGLIVDALHAFDGNLWEACDMVKQRSLGFSGDRLKTILKKDIIKRIKKFATNYFKGNKEKVINCLKDVYLFHKWEVISREYKEIDFISVDFKPTFVDVDTLGAMACSGGVCEIVNLNNGA